MMCPNGHAALQIAERNGVEIDYCPECRGVWLDRGELDKIIDRAEASSGSFRPADDRRDDRRDDGHRSHSGHGHPPHKKSKGSWLGEMFDF